MVSTVDVRGKTNVSEQADATTSGAEVVAPEQAQAPNEQGDAIIEAANVRLNMSV
jgi:hypothetical protein